MNQFVSDWSNDMGDAFERLGEDDGLIELLWCNGHVVMQSQASRGGKTPPPEKATPPAEMMPVDDASAPWFEYPVDEDIFSELFDGMPVAADAGKERGAVTAPRSRLTPEHGDRNTGPAPAPEADAGECSMATIASSVCGSYHVQTPGTVRGARAVPGTATAPPGIKKGGVSCAHVDTATVATSSTRSRSCATGPSPPGAASHGGGNRRRRDAVECESPSEGVVEFESAAAAEESEPAPGPKQTTAKRRRAAQVHNLSERRRRDRINEKMKALQELIPHCNKTDKASMLDEAIEYLKSLQLQLQMMWMGGGMAPPVMFPAAVHHQYMQRMASMPMMPQFMAPPVAVQSSPASHMPAVSMADAYTRRLAGDLLQPPSPMHYMQGMNFYQLTAAKNLQHNPVSTLAAVVPPATPPSSAS